ncbi:MAG: glycosyltransferase family 2 protein, partial [Fidelibacterota bacterium]
MKITIITVVLNDEVHIQKTIESVINQSWRDLEYLIIDGGSTDHTLSIIEKFRSKIQYLISEPDSGIYDAMNKGIRLANGKFTHFMNSGDTFDNPQVIHQIFSTIKSPKGIIYGDTRYQYPDGNTRIVRAHSEENIWKPFFNHQAAFFQTDILKETGFNSLYRPASDFHLVMKSRSDGIELQYIPKIINTFLIGGDIYQQEFKT